MQIGISYGDNDFMHTMSGFLRMVADSALVRCYPEQITKEGLLTIYRNTIYGIYLANQSCFMYSDEHTQEYLLKRVDRADRFYINEDIGLYLERFGTGCNSEFAYIDTGTNQVIYC